MTDDARNIPRPYETTYALMLLADSSSAEVRGIALADAFKRLKNEWKPGWDLSLVIRRPTEFELARLQEMSNGNQSQPE